MQLPARVVASSPKCSAGPRLLVHHAPMQPLGMVNQGTVLGRRAWRVLQGGLLVHQWLVDSRSRHGPQPAQRSVGHPWLSLPDPCCRVLKTRQRRPAVCGLCVAKLLQSSGFGVRTPVGRPFACQRCLRRAPALWGGAPARLLKACGGPALSHALCPGFSASTHAQPAAPHGSLLVRTCFSRSLWSFGAAPARRAAKAAACPARMALGRLLGVGCFTALTCGRPPAVA